MAYDRKANNAALNSISANLSNGYFGNLTKKTITFTGSGTGTGSGGQTTIVANVIGPILASIVAIGKTDLTDNGSITLGTTGSSAGIIGATVGSGITAGEIWHDTAPDSKFEETSVTKKYLLNDNITITVSTTGEGIATGAIDFYILWAPISRTGDVN